MKRNPLHGAALGRHRTPDEIATILQEQERSGLSLLAFAQKRQLCYATLLRWRRGRRQSPRSVARPPTAGPQFIPIQIEAGSSPSEYVLSWPQGRSLRIPPRFDPQALRQLLEVLEAQT